jgi:hypothetical protein
MSIATAKVEEIQEAAQQLADAAQELIDAREEGSGYDREDKQQANDDFENAISELVAALPKKDRPA